MLGIGSVAGYFMYVPLFPRTHAASNPYDSGNVDMTHILPFLGDTELEVLSVCGSFLLIAAHAITVFCVKERVVVASK